MFNKHASEKAEVGSLNIGKNIAALRKEKNMRRRIWPVRWAFRRRRFPSGKMKIPVRTFRCLPELPICSV